MDRIQGADTILLGPGQPGFRSKDTITGIPGTVLTAKWANDVQEEICGIIESAGLPLDPALRDQLLRAVRRGTLNFAVAGGGPSELTVQLDPAPKNGEIVAGMTVNVMIAADNTEPATIRINGSDPINITRLAGAPLHQGNLRAGMIATLIFDGHAFQIVNVGPPQAAFVSGKISSAAPQSLQNGVRTTVALQGQLPFAVVNSGTVTFASPGRYAVTATMRTTVVVSAAPQTVYGNPQLQLNGSEIAVSSTDIYMPNTGTQDGLSATTGASGYFSIGDKLQLYAQAGSLSGLGTSSITVTSASMSILKLD